MRRGVLLVLLVAWLAGCEAQRRTALQPSIELVQTGMRQDNSSSATELAPEFREAFDLEEKSDEEEGPPPEPLVQENDPREEGKEAKCDPNQPPDPAAFGGQEDATKTDLPDPGCELLVGCDACLSNRQCGWCAVDQLCTMSRSKSPECAFNENTDVCAPPCPDMWRLNWPTGRIGLVGQMCRLITDEYSSFPNSTVVHFQD